MKIANILIEHQMNHSRQILAESCDGLNESQTRIVRGIYKEMLPLIEASLTAQQIQSLFGEVEKSAAASGTNRTMLGKGVDVTKKANEVINSIGRWLQDTTPVKAFDQKFEQLKGKVAEKFPDLAKQTAALGEWVKANPGKSAAVIGVLTALASLAGGPVGGAIAGQILRGASELLKGEKLSTAIGKGIKTAALGYLSGKAFELLGNALQGMRLDSMTLAGAEEAGLEELSFQATRTITGPGMEYKQTLQGFRVAAFPEEAEAIKNAISGIQNGEAGAFDTLRELAKEVNSADYRKAMTDIIGSARADQIANDSLMNWIKGTAAAGQAISQGAVAAAGDAKNIGKDRKESYYLQTRPLSEGQVYLVFQKIQRLDEGPMDLIRKAGSKLSTMGSNLTNKITTDKLNSAWKKAGSPTESDELYQVLTAAGVTSDIVDQVYKSMQIPAPGEAAADPKAPAMDIEQVKKLVAALPTDRKLRLLIYLQGGKKSVAAAPKQSEIDADRERIMGPTSDSVIRRAPSLAEGKTK